MTDTTATAPEANSPLKHPESAGPQGEYIGSSHGGKYTYYRQSDNYVYQWRVIDTRFNQRKDIKPEEVGVLCHVSSWRFFRDTCGN